MDISSVVTGFAYFGYQNHLINESFFVRIVLPASSL